MTDLDTIICDLCGGTYSYKNKATHFKTKKHLMSQTKSFNSLEQNKSFNNLIIEIEDLKNLLQVKDELLKEKDRLIKEKENTIKELTNKLKCSSKSKKKKCETSDESSINTETSEDTETTEDIETTEGSIIEKKPIKSKFISKDIVRNQDIEKIRAKIYEIVLDINFLKNEAFSNILQDKVENLKDCYDDLKQKFLELDKIKTNNLINLSKYKLIGNHCKGVLPDRYWINNREILFDTIELYLQSDYKSKLKAIKKCKEIKDMNEYYDIDKDETILKAQEKEQKALEDIKKGRVSLAQTKE